MEDDRQAGFEYTPGALTELGITLDYAVQRYARQLVTDERVAVVRFLEFACTDDSCGRDDESGNCVTCSLVREIEGGAHVA